MSHKAYSQSIKTFPFAFNTPGLLTGYTVYVPVVGELLLDGWMEIDTPWDGTTPKGDFGTFTSPGANGVFFFGNGPVDMTQADNDLTSNAGIFVQAGSINTATDSIQSAIQAAGENWRQGLEEIIQRIMPAKFSAANPIKIVVSQDGSISGADPGSTQGSAILYLVTATPA